MLSTDIKEHQKAFDPVLNAGPEDYSGEQRKKLKDVQARTHSKKKRYHQHDQTARR